MKPTRMIPTACPICGEGLHIQRLACDGCDTALEGRFGFGRLGRLSLSQLQFVDAFLECRGKIKDVEQKLGISYPTVVARLDEVVAAMEGAPAAAPPEESKGRDRAQKTEVLEALARGEISAAEAANRLRSRKAGGT